MSFLFLSTGVTLHFFWGLLFLWMWFFLVIWVLIFGSDPTFWVLIFGSDPTFWVLIFGSGVPASQPKLFISALGAYEWRFFILGRMASRHTKPKNTDPNIFGMLINHLPNMGPYFWV